MKLEKREISLNEKDSLQDALLCESALLNAYMVAVRDAMRKQVRAEISQLMQEICEESWLILDLLAQTQTMEKQ